MQEQQGAVKEPTGDEAAESEAHRVAAGIVPFLFSSVGLFFRSLHQWNLCFTGRPASIKASLSPPRWDEGSPVQSAPVPRRLFFDANVSTNTGAKKHKGFSHFTHASQCLAGGLVSFHMVRAGSAEGHVQSSSDHFALRSPGARLPPNQIRQFDEVKVKRRL